MKIEIATVIFVAIAIFGISNICVQGSILNSFREWLKNKSIFLFNLIKCPMCLSFWFGLLIGSFYGPFEWYNPLNGFFYSATSWILWCLCQYLGNGYDASRVFNVLIPEEIKINHSSNNKNINN